MNLQYVSKRNKEITLPPITLSVTQLSTAVFGYKCTVAVSNGRHETITDYNTCTKSVNSTAKSKSLLHTSKQYKLGVT